MLRWIWLETPKTSQENQTLDSGPFSVAHFLCELTPTTGSLGTLVPSIKWGATGRSCCRGLPALTSWDHESSAARKLQEWRDTMCNACCKAERKLHWIWSQNHLFLAKARWPWANVWVHLAHQFNGAHEVMCVWEMNSKIFWDWECL